MGQYQQWVQYRAVDQQLRTQLEQLEQELVHLQEQADHLAGSASATENAIIQALVRQHGEARQPPASFPLPPTSPPPSSSLGMIQQDVDKPVDQQRMRTDLLIQRWMERWGRRPAQQSREEVMHERD
jgi:hypothetical protein